jgi:hypothetical protein
LALVPAGASRPDRRPWIPFPRRERASDRGRASHVRRRLCALPDRLRQLGESVHGEVVLHLSFGPQARAPAPSPPQDRPRSSAAPSPRVVQHPSVDSAQPPACAATPRATLICVHDWQHWILGIDTRTRTLDYRCESCGYEVTLIRRTRSQRSGLLPDSAIFPSLYFFSRARRMATPGRATAGSRGCGSRS